MWFRNHTTTVLDRMSKVTIEAFQAGLELSHLFEYLATATNLQITRRRRGLYQAPLCNLVIETFQMPIGAGLKIFSKQPAAAYGSQ
jgi:hypothetical protein